jgi:hypothetical protein
MKQPKAMKQLKAKKAARNKQDCLPKPLAFAGEANYKEADLLQGLLF